MARTGRPPNPTSPRRPTGSRTPSAQAAPSGSTPTRTAAAPVPATTPSASLPPPAVTSRNSCRASRPTTKPPRPRPLTCFERPAYRFNPMSCWRHSRLPHHRFRQASVRTWSRGGRCRKPRRMHGLMHFPGSVLPETGFEPARPCGPPAPQAGASANSATPAISAAIG